MIMSRGQNAGQSHNIKIDNSSFERVTEFEYLLTNFTIQNSIQEEIRRRLKSGNDCYHPVQNILFFGFISKRITIEIYVIISLRVVLCGRETWPLTLRKERRL
jgi:hypothetical protein